MYRRSDPRWNRTIQNITDTVEHANESAQEGLYSFTHAYVNPCFSSITQCVNACTAPCFPSHNDRRRHRARSRGRAEQSFDFYDDWEEDEDDGLLGWGNDNLERLWGGNSNYGTTSQPGRQRAMSYGNRNRDPRFSRQRRKSAIPPHDGGPDPTIIPSSSYFGFLGRLPFKIGGKVLRYKPSAADLTEHPGQSTGRTYEEIREEEAQPLIEESEEEAETQEANDWKKHGRKRSQTGASGHTTDSLSSRGDIFPSEDELDDAVALDDEFEFAVALERRTTGQWHDDTGSGKSRARSSSKSKRPSASRISTKSASSRNTQDSGRRSQDANPKQIPSDSVEEMPTLSDLKQEEEQLRLEEEAEVKRKRQGAQQLAVQRGLAPDRHLQVPRRRSPSPNPPSPQGVEQPAKTSPVASPLLLRTTSSEGASDTNLVLSPFPTVDTQTMPDSSSFHVDDSDYSSLAPTPNRPLSLKDEPSEVPISGDEDFVPARLPHFSAQPG